MTLVNLCHICSMVIHFKLQCKKIAFFLISCEDVKQERRYVRGKKVIDIDIQET